MRYFLRVVQALHTILGIGLMLFFAGLAIWICVRIILA
jgi:uncharacterized membrane protein